MARYDTAVIIPARNEEWLAITVKNVLETIRGNTQVVVVLDGEHTFEPVPKDPRVTVIQYYESIGQRAGTRRGAMVADAKYIIKTDAHCKFDEGFDVKMVEAFKEVGDNVTMVPIMKNLWMFDWKCYKCGKRIYQDKVPTCPVCGNAMRKKVLFREKENPQSTSYCFDAEPHFQYFKEYTRRPEYKQAKEANGLTESMSVQGSFFMMTKDMYFDLNIDDESFGSWGSQGIEVACKTWLSGGRVIINHRTWYAHLFRTKPGVFGFPYKLSGKQVEEAKAKARDLFFNNKWEKQVRPLSWLIRKFFPIPGWTEEQLLALENKNEIPSRNR